MEHVELVVFGLLVGAAGLAVLARAVNVPYPIILVLGGAVIGFVPGVPDVAARPGPRAPDLPPAAALRRGLLHLAARPAPNARPIALLSIGVVTATMAAVAVVAHEVIGLGLG